MKILIAEDEPSLRQNLQWMLEMEGYEVATACDGREAFAQACVARPDLVITDVMMPNLDGYGLVKALREHRSTATVPIVMLSAKADRSDVRMGMNLGADDYLTKPYRREELLETLRARMSRSLSMEKATQDAMLGSATSTALDSLTALPGREAFDARVLLAQGNDASVAVICFGMDGFSKINESLGKAVGDQVLVEVAARLSNRLPSGANQTWTRDAIGRLGGDQFAMCLAGALDDAVLEAEVGQILALLAAPYEAAGQSLFMTACAGASLQHANSASPNPNLGAVPSPLLLHAESALYRAKPAGPGSYRLFDAASSQQVLRNLQIHNDLHRALEQGELQVFYQPQVSIQTGALVGFEALVRWQHPALGWISPAEFIPIAEESGLIVKLGEWVMRTAARQAAVWTQLGHTSFRMAVNLSVRQFAGNRLPGLVAQVLQDTGLSAHILELEVTESLALQSIASTLSTLHECKALGVKIAMDDFGTGYSSLAYLKRYPLDALKIDQSFVRNITEDAGDAAITRAIVAMAHSFGMSVIAEGVETTDQLEFLRALGCEEFQGYLFSRPVPAEEAVKCFAGYRKS